MEFWPVLLIQYLIVIILFSSQELSFPIQIRRWCRNRIGAFPSGLISDGFLCLRLDFFGLQHHQDPDHDSPFFKLRKDLQTRNWDPGDSNCKFARGGLLSLTRHTYGTLSEFVSAIWFLGLPRSETSLILCAAVDINLRFEDVMAISLSDQLVRLLRDMTDSHPFQCCSSLVLSIRWNRVVLRCRRCFPGVFSRHWWIFRLSAGDNPLARGYGGFIWVFDPGINITLVEEKDVFILGIGEITDLYLMRTTKNSQTHWITSHGLMPLSMFGEDEAHVSDLSGSTRKTKKSIKRRLEKFFAFMEITQACLVVSNIWCTFDLAFGVKIFTNVYGVKCTIGWAYPGATSLFYVMWSFNARMPKRHTYHIRVR